MKSTATLRTAFARLGYLLQEGHVAECHLCDGVFDIADLPGSRGDEVECDAFDGSGECPVCRAPVPFVAGRVSRPLLRGRTLRLRANLPAHVTQAHAEFEAARAAWLNHTARLADPAGTLRAYQVADARWQLVRCEFEGMDTAWPASRLAELEAA